LLHFNHLVGVAEQREWNGEADRIGGLKIGLELEFGRLHGRQIGRVSSFENADQRPEITPAGNSCAYYFAPATSISAF
jgi:hypothetical protein